MKKFLSLHLLIMFVIAGIMSSCVPGESTSNSRKKTTTNNTISENDQNNNENEIDANANQDIFWFSGGSNIEGTLSINEDIENSIAIKGQTIQAFLSNESNFSQRYCLVVNFNILNASAKKSYRVRAVPLKLNNIFTGNIERIFRLEFDNEQANMDSCAGTIDNINSSGNADGTISTAESAFEAVDICPDCSGILSSSKIDFYEIVNNSISSSSRVSDSQLDGSLITLRVDTKSSVTEQNNSCSNSTCQARGFDCCLNGQCVNDGAQRPNASSHPDFNQAQADVQNNPANFINWPDIFFICGNNSNGNNNDNDDEENQSDNSQNEQEAQARLEALVKQFNCLEEGKKEVPDFPSAGVCEPNFDQASFETVRSDVWRQCGCAASPFPTEPTDPRCPDYGLVANRNDTGDIISVDCFVPDQEDEFNPVQDTNISLSARSAPHRFFDSSGKSYDDITQLRSSSPDTVQEGDDFSYGDNVGKTEPIISPFSMNSILGQMSIRLDEALPAKQVDVEFDQTYVIAATSGFFTPCPQCADDSWFSTFTAFPTTRNGTGLRAEGFTTRRDAFVDNTSRGNYEDTIFGRACFVPPTMIPNAHSNNIDLQTQRLNRLKTQTSQFVNGYQRDWYGFNQGALIGSFDGVKWFAIGTGRRITAKSRKLFLAINAPYADLADNTTINVSIHVATPSDVAADRDFDSTLTLNDPRQNSAGTCQSYHLCNVDSDCISRLGWEYMCADVTNHTMNFPVFDVDGNEQVNQSQTLTFNELIENFEVGNGKRCVYRGAGAICKNNIVADVNSTNQKILSCAPNFHCSKVEENVYNSRVVRTPNELDDILFGQDANFLGRPLSYLSSQNSLPTSAKDNFRQGFKNFLPVSDQSDLTKLNDFGFCRPSKDLTADNWAEQQKTKDSQGRADYISQIAPCNSSAVNEGRVSSCPAIITRPINNSGELLSTSVGDYAIDTFSNDEVLAMKLEQNMCGGESIRTTSNGEVSAFKDFEGPTLFNTNNATEPVIVKDACLRRAGSVCHTNLDCGPNRLHAARALELGVNDFGGTLAELEFWSEELICSQERPIPSRQSEEFLTYNLTNNRCCRAVGNDFSMYTECGNGDLTQCQTIMPEFEEENLLLKVAQFPTDSTTSRTSLGTNQSDGPNAQGRYSRYRSVSLVASSDIDSFATSADSNFTIPKVTPGSTPDPFQWKTLNKTGEENCCGGGWIRKFADGSNNWKIRNRVNIDIENFQCLNYTSLWPFNRPTASVDAALTVPEPQYNREKSLYCLSPADGGCIENPIAQVTGFEIVTPLASPITQGDDPELQQDTLVNTPLAVHVLDTTPLADPGNPTSQNTMRIKLSRAVPFAPRPIAKTGGTNLNQNPNNPNESIGPFLIARRENPSIHMEIPSYIDASTLLDTANCSVGSDATNQPHEVDITTGCKVRINYLVGAEIISGFGQVPIRPVSTDDAGITTNGICPVSLFGGAGNTGDATNGPYAGDPGSPIIPVNSYCVHVNAQNVTLHANLPFSDFADDEEGTDDDGDAIPNYRFASILIEFTPHEVAKSDLSGNGTIGLEDDLRTQPGNALYYLTKLGRLELTGIPQIFYEPLYCNNAKDSLVPGIMKPANAVRSNFEGDSSTFEFISALDNNNTLSTIYEGTNNNVDDANSGKRVTLQDGLDPSVGTVFSESDFMCCTELGNITDSASRCCSGHAVANDDDQLECKLPAGTNLNVYFNKFVSSEGVGEDLPGGGLAISDFVAETGEPKINTSVNNKISALGVAFCENAEVRKGAAFGFFFPEPNQGFFVQSGDPEDSVKFSIVDSLSDNDEENGNSAINFLEGLRWNHHFYCN